MACFLLENKISHFYKHRLAQQTKSQHLRSPLSTLFLTGKQSIFPHGGGHYSYSHTHTLFSKHPYNNPKLLPSHPKSFLNKWESKYTQFMVLWVLWNVFIYIIPLDHLGDKDSRNSYHFLTNEETLAQRNQS